ncbi:hypothetical protein G6F22_015221 [Rhizopus arrhizus]|nr:hypothetical protein G6F22_015221 [Rhizopus arrhizus]
MAYHTIPTGAAGSDAAWTLISLRPQGQHVALRRAVAGLGGHVLALSPWRLQRLHGTPVPGRGCCGRFPAAAGRGAAQPVADGGRRHRARAAGTRHFRRACTTADGQRRPAGAAGTGKRAGPAHRPGDRARWPRPDCRAAAGGRGQRRTQSGRAHV